MALDDEVQKQGSSKQNDKNKKKKSFYEEERHLLRLERGQDKELVVDWRMKQRV
jgi:hypothetical protein